MKTARSCCLVALVVELAMTARAVAQSPEAAALFKQGKRLAEEGDYAGACEKFETSERLDPSGGTEGSLGRCHEELGHTATAWVWYQKALASAKKINADDRVADAKQHIADLESRLVHLTVRVPRESRVEGLVVKLNERELERGEWNQELPLDPDTYTVTAEAPNRKSWSDSIAVKTKDREIEVPKLARAKAKKRNRATADPDEPNRNRSLVIALGSSGLGAVAIATGFGIYSQSAENQADTLCPMIVCKDAHAVDLNHAARTSGWIANIGWVLGAGALAGAGIAWYLGRVTVAPDIDGDRVAVVIGGRF